MEGTTAMSDSQRSGSYDHSMNPGNLRNLEYKMNLPRHTGIDREEREKSPDE